MVREIRIIFSESRIIMGSRSTVENAFKSFFLRALLIVLLMGPYLSMGQVTIKGCIKKLPEGTDTLTIAFLQGKQLRVKAYVPMDKGCFNFQWPHEERGIFIGYLGPNATFDFLLTDGTVQISGNYEKLEGLEISGDGQAEFKELKEFLSTGPTQEETKDFLYGLTNSDLREFMLPQIIPMTADTNVFWLRSHFWDHTNLKSVTTLINPFFDGNRNLYFEQILGHEPDTIIGHLRKLFAQPMHPEVKKVLVSRATYYYETSTYMGEDEVFVWLVNEFYKTGFASWVGKNDLADIVDKADGLSTELLGRSAPDFAFDVFNGGRMKLSEVSAPLTILYFWDSGCGHCKRQTPKLKKLYDEYKNRGIQVVAVTLESEFENWEKYIREHELDWINGYESNFERPNFLWYYYIPSTPKLLVLDADKRIIAKKLDIETTLKTFLDDRLREIESH